MAPSVTRDDPEQALIESFLLNTVQLTCDTAAQFLNEAKWDIEVATNLFRSHISYPRQVEQIPPPLPSRRDTTSAGPSMFHPSSVQGSRLSSLYHPPSDLLFKGSFQDAKSVAFENNLWVLVNLQSETEFASYALNRDLWSNQTVPETIKSNFILLQVYDGTSEGQTLSTLFKIDSVPPVILLVDPLTGMEMRRWSGVIESNRFLEELVTYMAHGPYLYVAPLTSNKRIRTDEIAGSSSNKHLRIEPRDFTCVELSQADCTKEEDYEDESESESDDEDEDEDDEHEEDEEEEDETYMSSKFMVLTEEPKEDCEGNLVCSVCVRFPDGGRKLRKILKTESIQLLWSFCYDYMEESEKKRTSKLVQAIPGASKTLDYEANETFEESGLANSMISVTLK